MALEDMGLLKSGASKLGSVAKVTNNPNNWTLKGGLSSWLNNSSLQEKSMDRLMDQNLRVLKGVKGFNKFSRPNIAGALAAAHLVGAGGAKKFLAGNDSADAYGTKASDYFELGKNAITAAKGFSGIVKKPTVFLTGEAGPELVHITPLVSPDAKTAGLNNIHSENAQLKDQQGSAATMVNAPSSTSVTNNSGSNIILASNTAQGGMDLSNVM